MALTTADDFPEQSSAVVSPPFKITGAIVKIKMKAQVTGTRDGVAWPAPGETVDLPDNEAAKLCASGLAEPVNTRGKDTEKAVAPKAEIRTTRKKA